MSDSVTLWTAACKASLSTISHICSNSCPLSWWSHPTNSSSVDPISSCFQSFLASVPFPVSWNFVPGGQNTRASTSASVLQMNIQSGFSLGLTGLISLQSKGLSRVFSNQRFKSINSSVLSLLYGPTLPYIHNYWKKNIALIRRKFVAK